jgi:hypothetical protein
MFGAAVLCRSASAAGNVASGGGEVGDRGGAKGGTMSTQCLVCTGAAKDLTTPGFDGRIVGCLNCGNYEIAGSAWQRFRNASQDERLAALKKGKAFQTLSRPTITSTCF